MDLLKAAGVFVGWLSGSLATITAMLYAFGYLATLSNLHSLGLDPAVLEFDAFLYLQRGSSLALYLLRLIFNTLWYVLVSLVILSIPGFLVYHLWRDRLSAVGSRIMQRLQQHGTVLRGLALGILILLLVLRLWPTYQNLTGILGVSDLLFAREALGDSNVLAVRQALLDGDAQRLRTLFYFSQLFLLISAILFYVSWRLASPWRWRSLVVAPFALLFLMFFASIPMIYGVVVLESRFSTVHITRAGGGLDDPERYYLLNKTAQEFVLWDDETSKIVWLPVNSVTKAEIGRREALPFAPAKSQQEPP